MRIHEVRALSQEDMEKALAEAYREALNVRFRLATRQMSDTSQAKKVKRKIAQFKTVMQERKLLEQQT